MNKNSKMDGILGKNDWFDPFDQTLPPGKIIFPTESNYDLTLHRYVLTAD